MKSSLKQIAEEAAEKIAQILGVNSHYRWTRVYDIILAALYKAEEEKEKEGLGKPEPSKAEDDQTQKALLVEVYDWLTGPLDRPLGMREYIHCKIGNALGKERVEYHE